MESLGTSTEVTLVFVPVQPLPPGPICCGACGWHVAQLPHVAALALIRTAYHPACGSVYTKKGDGEMQENFFALIMQLSLIGS